ncbi:MAG: NUDIX hydrolase [Lacisediminimonas sp.]|nr:NUDIX hydrolase [Lacisediminimonas sp.]
MPRTHIAAPGKAVSCGTLVRSARGKLLLGHATNTDHWDIPKGLQEAGESALRAAQRELFEETGLVFADSAFQDLGLFAYRQDKMLHLFKVQAAQSLDSLDTLHCTSFFPHHRTGKPTPEMDRYCWARREQVSQLCAPRMAAQILALDW